MSRTINTIPRQENAIGVVCPQEARLSLDCLQQSSDLLEAPDMIVELRVHRSRHVQRLVKSAGRCSAGSAAVARARDNAAWMSKALVLIGGFLGIAALIAVQLLALYFIARLVLIVASCVPMVGKKHRHPDRNRSNLP